jgi:arginine:agmatine antiporter
MPVQEIVMAEAKKIGVVGATFLVAGNMMGSGVFLLPSSLAKIGTASIWGWLITTAGALLLAFVFAKLGKLAPKAGGPYAYARDWFGPYMGFQTNTIYWFANWIGNVAIPIAAVGYFSYFFPILSEPLVRCIAVLVLVWALSFRQRDRSGLRQPRADGHHQLCAGADPGHRHLRLVLLRCRHLQGRLQRVGRIELRRDLQRRGTDPVGLHRRRVGLGDRRCGREPGEERGPRHAGRRVPGRHRLYRQFLGDHGHGAQRELQVSDAPFALAAAKAVGGWGGALVSLCAFIGAAGSLGGWILLTAQSAKAASDDGLFPSIFSKTNKDDVPVKGVLIVAVLMTLAVLVTSTSETASAQFDVITSAAVVLTLLPYIYSCVACYFVVERSHTLVHTGAFWTLTSLTVVYCLWAIYGSSGTIVQYAFLFVLFITVFYPFFSEERRQQRQRAREASAISAGAQRS